jgi:beta-lactamase superfamily II metal-dependent hydrolase
VASRETEVNGSSFSWRSASVLVIALVALALARGSAARALTIYFIDVEGGQSTLIVTPAGESLLVDTGYDGFEGRDAKRILAAARDAGRITAAATRRTRPPSPPFSRGSR